MIVKEPPRLTMEVERRFWSPSRLEEKFESDSYFPGLDDGSSLNNTTEISNMVLTLRRHLS